MKAAGRAGIVVMLLAGAAGLVWMFSGTDVSSRANVIAGVAELVAVVLAVVVLWPRGRRGPVAVVAAGQVPVAVEYLAGETLRYWRVQAKDRRITTPSPAAVRWSWAGEEVAVPAGELQPAPGSGGPVTGPVGRMLTAGVVTELREQLYDRLGGERARVVILGGPGAGKTAAMLLLLIDILEHRPAGSGQPVPVWLTLGGWNPTTTPLQDWASATLTRDYPGLAARGYGGGRAMAAELIRTGRVALFLDGLDEMPDHLQGRALQAIDRDATGLRVVLTSRPEQYRAAVEDGRLYGAAVIDVLPVDLDHAEAFLLAEQLGDRRRRWQQVTDHLRAHPDSPAAGTLTSPLALTLARDVYTRADPTDLLDTGAHPSPQALLQHLLARSLTLAYPDPRENQHATGWLCWIARRMGTSRDLRWWDIPAWTPRSQRRLGVGVMFGLVAGLVAALGLEFGIGVELELEAGLRAGLAFGLMSGLVAGLRAEPRTLVVRWPAYRELRHSLLVGLRAGLRAGLGIGLGLGLMYGLAFEPLYLYRYGLALLYGLGTLLLNGLAAGLVAGLAFGVVAGLVDLWSTPLATAQAVSPIEVFRSDRRQNLVAGLLAWLLAWLVLGRLFGLVIGLVIGLAVLLGVGFGVGPGLQLAVVEVMWALRGRRVRFVPLLQTALDRQVLRQAGAVYQFRHAALQDLLARPEGSPNLQRALSTDRRPDLAR